MCVSVTILYKPKNDFIIFPFYFHLFHSQKLPLLSYRSATHLKPHILLLKISFYWYLPFC